MNRIVFLVTNGNSHVITYSHGREGAKRHAQEWLAGDPDRYTVTPLTRPGDRIVLNMPIFA